MNAPINLMHLKFFCDAVQYGSISEAAKVNFVTQSTVSQAITKLEKTLNVELVHHARQKFNLTEDGRVVYEKSRHVFKAIQNIHDHIESSKAEIGGSLTFVSTNSLGMSFLAPLYKQMQLQYPAVQLNFRLGNLSLIRNALRQGEAEFAIVVNDEHFSQFSKYTLKKGCFHLYQHCDAQHHSLEDGILADHAAGMYLAELQEHFLQQESPLKIQSELAGWEVVARFTEMNVGIGFFPDYITENNRYPKIKIYPHKIPKFEYEICAIFNRGDKPSRAALAFLELFTLEK